MSDVDVDSTIGNLDQVLSQIGRRLLRRISQGDWSPNRTSDDAFALLDAKLGLYHPRIVSGECAKALALLETCRTAGYIPDLQIGYVDRRIISIVRGVLHSQSVPSYVDPMSEWTLGLAFDYVARVQDPGYGVQAVPPSDWSIGLLSESIALATEHRASKEIMRFRRELHRLEPADVLGLLLRSQLDVDRAKDPSDWPTRHQDILQGFASDLQFMTAISDLLSQMSDQASLRGACWCLASNELGNPSTVEKLRVLVDLLDSIEDRSRQVRVPEALAMQIGLLQEQAMLPRWSGAKQCKKMLDETSWIDTRNPSRWTTLRNVSERLLQ